MATLMQRPSSYKPVDERWMARALEFVIDYRDEHGVGCTWRELFDAMNWQRRKFKSTVFMHKLSRRGLVWTPEERSLDVSPEGRELLAQWEEAQER